MPMLLDKKPNPGTQLDAMLQAFPDLLFTLDQNGVLLDYKGNEHVSTLFASAEALIGQRLADVLPREFGENLRQALGELKRDQGPVSFEYSSKQAGVTRWFETRLVRAPADQIIVVVRDATRHKEAEERIKAQLRRMASLRSIDLAISSSLDLNLALSVILSQVTAELGVDAADILLLNNRNILEYVTGVGFRTDAMKSTNLRLGQAYAGAVAARGEVIQVEDLRNGQKGFLRAQACQQEGFHCYYGVPLVAKGRVRGVLEVFHRLPLTPDREWLDFLEALAGQAAIAVENGMLLRELQKTNFELRLAYDTTIDGHGGSHRARDVCCRKAGAAPGHVGSGCAAGAARRDAARHRQDGDRGQHSDEEGCADHRGMGGDPPASCVRIRSAQTNRLPGPGAGHSSLPS
jgi:PAS domain S-box-containing protein